MIHALQRGWQQPGWLNWLALPVSLIYRLLVALRRGGYRAGLLHSHRLPVPVIVVGNISVGGTGKTPLVVALVAHLQAKGMKPGIVSRGYRGESGFWPRALVDGDSAAEVGDEPLMLFRRTGVPVVVGPDRVLSGRMLVDKFDCDVVISDDGFQHYALEREVDIVVIDGERGLGNGWCLPAGPLREPGSAIQRADLIVVNGDSETIWENAYPMTLQPRSLWSLQQPESETPLSSMRDKTVHAVAALGNPQRFFDTLKSNGLQVTAHEFDDHHQYRESDFGFASPDDIVIMTEKDAVKCGDLAIAATCWVLGVDASVAPAFFDSLDQKLAISP